MRNIKIISDNSTITIGNNNVVHVRNEVNIDWESLENELFALIHKLPDSSNEFTAIQNAIKYTVNRDEKGLAALIKSHLPVFTSGLFSSMAGAFLVDFIKNFI